MPDSKTETGFAFGTKAETLARLSAVLGDGPFCRQIIVPVPRWRREPEQVISEVLARFSNEDLVVRSSSAREDGWDGSMAGAFVSLTSIAPDRDAIARAIEQVIASYGGAGENDQVLVQPKVRDVAISGVVATRDLDTGGPYYVVSYDDFSGRTDTVTGGAESKTILVHRSRPEALHSTRFRKLIEIVREIERVTRCGELDIEFCITHDEVVRILQARPLAARVKWRPVDDPRIDRELSALRGRLEAMMAPADGIAGRTTILGEMPDWNPAEMIGNAPRPLALSLYRDLITDDVWWRARAEMGYRAVPRPLLIDLAGRPFIDVRLSLNSFLPAVIDEALAAALVDRQIEALAAAPDLHDKIEFAVAVTCRDFAFGDCARELKGCGFSPREIAELEAGLTAITARALAAGAAGIAALLARTRSLPRDPAPGAPPRARARGHLEACRTQGTPPFASLARHAFIGVALMRSLVRRGAISRDDLDGFLRGVHTVARHLVHDMHLVGTGTLSQQDFLDRYGHLRPGTYDILSWRYDERPDLYLGAGTAAPTEVPPFALSPGTARAIEALLREAGFAVTPEALLDYVAAAIAAREEAKFAFSRSVSDALKALGHWGEQIGLGRDEISFIPIAAILAGGDDAGRLRTAVERGREAHTLTRTLRLPYLIREVDDLDVVRMPLGEPNFITSKSVTAFARIVETNRAPEIDGCIVLIESADPGFDWIFSHRIAGLVTKYGGANSHMAIRCAEFGLPAAIGCGERLFAALARNTAIELNCGARTVRGTRADDRRDRRL